MSALRGLLAEIRAQQHSSLRLHFRRIATSNSPGLGSSEFRVPVPWGFIAGQEWGEELSSSSKPPWIVLHGWLDNSGSFNGLAPLFRERGHRLLCIDLPGHGLSSHIPLGMGYHFIEGISYIKRVADHFGLQKFNLMGHSMGGAMCSVFAATFPNQVLQLIEVDALLPINRPVENVVERTKSSIEQMQSFEKKIIQGRPPSYSYKEAKTKLLEDYSNFHGQDCLTSHAADALLLRGLTKASNIDDKNDELTFSRDLRHRVPGLYGYPWLVWQEFGKRISCPHLVISAEPKPAYFDPETGEDSRKVCEDSNPYFTVRIVSGTHFVHLNDPTTVFRVAEEFLGQYPVSDHKMEDV